MGLLDKTRALGYSRSAELMADVRILQGKCRKAVTEWGGGDPATGGGFGSGSGRMLVRAMDTLAATLEGLLARSREEVSACCGSDPLRGLKPVILIIPFPPILFRTQAKGDAASVAAMLGPDF